MPTYSYICDGCGKSFELEQRIIEDPIKKCVLCGKAKAKRQIVSGNFILKGGGWYSDGYGSSSSAKSVKSDKSESSSKSDKVDKADSSAKSEKADSPKPEKSESTPKVETPKAGSTKAQAAT